MNSNTFTDLGLDEKLLRILDEIGYQEPSPIQAQAIPELLDGRDLLGIAQTGTGKTAAFSLPLLQILQSRGKATQPKKPQALILSPTRELTVQIRDEIERLGKYTKLQHAIVIGGVKENPQIRALARGVDILVATPGRLLDLANNRHVDLSEVSVLVLDEADRLLDMGFVRDVRKIVDKTSRNRQSLLFSATMPKEVASLAREILNNPVRIDVSPKEITVDRIEQNVLQVDNPQKQRALETLLRNKDVARAIVFTRTKHGASKVAQKLVKAGISAEAIHGNKSQNARQRALESFKTGDAWVLVATDIAARGIDVDGVTHVINYELPHEPESYVHRIGRTARAGASGVAWSLVDREERKRQKAIERLIGFSIKEIDGELKSDVAKVVDIRQVPQTTPQNSSSAPKTGAVRPGEENPKRRRPRRRRRAAAT